MRTSTILLVVSGVFFVLAATCIGMYVSANNVEVSLRARFNAQQKVNEASFDKVWKTIQQNAEVANTERDSFRKTFAEIMTAQQGVAGKGALASFFTQAKVDITPQLFERLMVTIESQRESFFRDQKTLLDIKREHDTLRTTLPSSLFVGSREQLTANLVISDKTREAFKSGENDVKLFKE